MTNFTNRFEFDYRVDNNQIVPFIWDFSTDTDEGCQISEFTLNSFLDLFENPKDIFDGKRFETIYLKDQRVLENLYNQGNIIFNKA